MVAALWACQVSQGSNTRGSTSVDERACGLTVMRSLTISLKIYDFVIYSVFAHFPWFVPSCFTQNKHGHELRGHWDPPLQQPQVEAGRVPSWEGVAGSHGWHPPHRGILSGHGGAPAGPRLSALCSWRGICYRRTRPGPNGSLTAQQRHPTKQCRSSRGKDSKQHLQTSAKDPLVFPSRVCQKAHLPIWL